jgi:catechol 2,3-dioxygenase-like lactoylglutathione lyase family enzyme
MAMKLNSARVFVNDIAAAKSFYSESLALPLRHGGEEFGFFVFCPGAMDLIVELVPADAPLEDLGLVGRFTGLSFTVTDIQSKYAEMLGKGITFTGRPEAQSWGGILATFKDPAGNELQLVQQAAV